MNGSFGFKLSENFNVALPSMHTQQIFFLSGSFDHQNGHQSFRMKTGS